LGYPTQSVKISNSYSPYLDVDKYGNEIYYCTLSEPDYKKVLIEGKIPATNETFISPLAEYSKKYDGILVKFTTKLGTSNELMFMLHISLQKKKVNLTLWNMLKFFNLTYCLC